MLSFTEVALSCLVYAILFTVALLSALLLYFVPAHTLLYLVGLQLFVRGGVKTAKNAIETHHPLWAVWKKQQTIVPMQGRAMALSNATGAGGGSASNLHPPMLLPFSKPSPLPAAAAAAASPSPDSVTSKKPGLKRRIFLRLKSLLKRTLLLLKRFIRWVQSLFTMLRFLYMRSPDFYEQASVGLKPAGSRQRMRLSFSVAGFRVLTVSSVLMCCV